jgi:hypothetical protein
MTATAVVTGSPARVDDVTRAMERRGISVLGVHRGDDLGQAARAVAAGSLGYFVQLPDDVPSPHLTRSRALAALLGSGLASRFCEVDALMGKMAPTCAVVLVTGETVDDLSGPESVEYPHAPTCVLEMLAEAIVSDMAPSAVRATVVSHRHSADQIAAIALATGPERAAMVAGYAERVPEMSFDDWRLACLSTTGPEA